MAITISNRSTSAGIEIITQSLSITHIGDSYSSGNGAGDYYGLPDDDNSKDNPFRSRKNWGEKYNSWIKSQGISSTYTNLAHSGFTTNDVLNKTISKVPTNTDLILMTVGGNDIDFNGIVTKCFAPLHISAIGCQRSIENAHKNLPNIAKQTEKIFSELQNRLSSNAEVILVSYPLLSTNINYNDYIKECIGPKERGCKLKTYKYSPAREVRALGLEAVQVQKKLVNDWNSKNQLKINFVDQTAEVFSGHEPDPKPYDKNGHRWINEFFETEGIYIPSKGTVESKYSVQTSDWYHPNITGHQKIAELVQKQIGIPKSARNITPTSGDIDIAIIANSSTGERIPPYLTIRRNIFKVADPLRSRARSMNIFLAGYSFLPVSESTAHDLYDPFLDYDNLEDYHRISPGGGLQQDYNLNDAIYRALNENWRPGVKKIIIHLDKYWHSENDHLLWSTSPKYTNADIIKKAFEVDPVEIYSIGDNKSVHLADLMEITSGTGGFSIVNEDSVMTDDDISNEITKLVNHIVSKPFAWLQGPYIVKIGEPITFDARGSYSSNGNIVKYEWDFNGDGIYDKTTTSGETTETFQSEHWGYMGVRVTDSTGLSSIGSTEFIISDDGDSTPRAIDNCPDVYNHSQADTDGDGIGDECDPTHGVPDWLDGSQNPESLIDGLIMSKTNVPAYLKMVYGSNDEYIESLIEENSTPNQIIATVKSLDLKISKKTQAKISSIANTPSQTSVVSGINESLEDKEEKKEKESNEEENDAEQKEENKETSIENAKPISAINEPNQTNTKLIIIISASIIILVAGGLLVFKKLKRS